jgi:hypothetical protein
MASAVCLSWRAASQAGRSFDSDPIGFFHIDLAEVRTGKLYLFVAIDRTSKFAVVELVKGRYTSGCGLPRRAHPAVPYRIHTVLTDNGIQFADLPKNLPSPRHRTPPH